MELQKRRLFPSKNTQPTLFDLDRVQQLHHDHKQKDKEKFQELVNEGTKPLLKIQTIFPLDLFPDDLILDSIKVTQVHRVFFWTEQVISFPIQDIKYVTVESIPFLSTIKIMNNTLPPTQLILKPFWNRDAIKMHNLIQGLIAGSRQNIDMIKIQPERELPKIEEIGAAE